MGTVVQETQRLATPAERLKFLGCLRDTASYRKRRAGSVPGSRLVASLFAPPLIAERNASVEVV